MVEGDDIQRRHHGMAKPPSGLFAHAADAVANEFLADPLHDDAVVFDGTDVVGKV